MGAMATDVQWPRSDRGFNFVGGQKPAIKSRPSSRGRLLDHAFEHGSLKQQHGSMNLQEVSRSAGHEARESP
jgi:hypothetical protein